MRFRLLSEALERATIASVLGKIYLVLEAVEKSLRRVQDKAKIGRDKIAGSDFEQRRVATLARESVGQDARKKAQFT